MSGPTKKKEYKSMRETEEKWDTKCIIHKWTANVVVETNVELGWVILKDCNKKLSTLYFEVAQSLLFLHIC